ncbi:hypothetical protein FJV41_44900 [Myxococcus llanfairpwllgwyngyllgogerychwyrndrobwllllantysiliogogogochensis]|uniref:Uncharacterized protein n=1 Tax=Myxococcus llanfairpwllgwyngyllgogerychwyrndrobwllllantysiliogogogochensis TaxID=2590453 RepID=A0A540WK55_9BACT|nr:hypothetical protein FJV41_44900 [Myxococcus llanfairpwllgwyngyllgogerychwyrndrobwllllantysiliogogogochensis]
MEAGSRVLADLKGAPGVQAILEHLGLPTASARLALARGPPGRAGDEAHRLKAAWIGPPRDPLSGYVHLSCQAGHGRVASFPKFPSCSYFRWKCAFGN